VTPIRLEAEIQRLLLDPPDGPVAEIPVAYGDFLGTYTADFGPFDHEPFEVLWRDNGLALDIPSQLVFAMVPIEGEQRWTLQGAPGVEVSFDRSETGQVTGMRIDQAGQVFDVPKGAFEPEPDVSLAPQDVERYLGWFRDPETDREVEVVYHEGHLALHIPEATEPLALDPPEGDGRWRVRLNPLVEIRFTEQGGEIVSYTASSPDGEATFERIEAARRD
jgi:hypothetical protein